MKLFRFRLGFLVGYLVAVIRRADENDPMIQRLRSVQEGAGKLKDRWRRLPKDHALRRGAKRVSKIAA